MFHTGNVNNYKSKDLPLRKQYSGNEMFIPSGDEGKLIKLVQPGKVFIVIYSSKATNHI